MDATELGKRKREEEENKSESVAVKPSEPTTTTTETTPAVAVPTTTTTTSTTETQNNNNNNNGNPNKKQKMTHQDKKNQPKKFAVIFGYNGMSHKGLQKQKHKQEGKTIEDDLEVALKAANVVPPEANFANVEWSRSCRTDKGVGALGNLIALKIKKPEKNPTDEVNKHLPPSIRVWDICQVTPEFNSKNAVDHRVYEYLVPTYAFRQKRAIDFSTGSAVISKLKHPDRSQESKASTTTTTTSTTSSTTTTTEQTNTETQTQVPPTQQTNTTSSAPETQATEQTNTTTTTNTTTPQPKEKLGRFASLSEDEKYKIDPTTLQKVRDLFKSYEGTHNFHNFTAEKKYNDNSAKRFLHSVKCSDPFDCFGVECVRITLVGQSFMIHQIRKMIGLVIVVSYYGLSARVLKYACQAEDMTLMMTPGEYLLLDHPVFKSYNRKVQKINQGLKEIHIDLFPGRDDFKVEQIYKPMMEKEREKKLMRDFVNRIPMFRPLINGKTADWYGWLRRGENYETVNALPKLSEIKEITEVKMDDALAEEDKKMAPLPEPTNEDENEGGDD